MVQSKMFQRVKIFIFSLAVVCLFFSSSGCDPRSTSSDSGDLEYISLNYLKRLKNKDMSLLEELNFIADVNVAVTSRMGSQEGKRGFYIQLENLSDRVMFIHRPEYSIVSSIYQMDGGNWIDISMDVYPSTAIPYVLLPKKILKLFFPIKSDLPEDINIQGDISIPRYTNIASKGELQYSEYRLIKRFKIIKNKGGNSL